VSPGKGGKCFKLEQMLEFLLLFVLFLLFFKTETHYVSCAIPRLKF
jgi:hypothetical protein